MRAFPEINTSPVPLFYYATRRSKRKGDLRINGREDQPLRPACSILWFVDGEKGRTKGRERKNRRGERKFDFAAGNSISKRKGLHLPAIYNDET